MLFGKKLIPLRNCTLENDRCPVCERKDSRHLFLLQEYVHFFFMPLIPVGKTGQIRCQNCPSKFRLSDDQNLELQDMRKGVFTPLSTFTGVLVIFLLLVGAFTFVILDARSTHKKNISQPSVNWLIRHPKSGDMYELEVQEGLYSWARIDDVSADSVWFELNDEVTPIREGLSAIRGATYDSLMMVFSRQDLPSLLDKRQVLAIHRDK